MAIYGTFIGIDKHQDMIRELEGARRDATALWALFTDSVPGIRSQLLVDADATKSAIIGALTETLSGAGTDDTVVVTFSGHGTRSHRLVTYDSLKSNLSETTISMDILAQLFKESAAKYILFVLDCCFSGGAPARVFEESPISRDVDGGLEMLCGNGRLLIAAANTNEAAFEHPSRRHGFLSLALIETLQSCERSDDLSELISSVMDIVRAESSRFGTSQVPMYFGLIEGGMRLPKLSQGKLYHSAFPEPCGAQVQADFTGLDAFGIPEAVVNSWRDRYPDGMNKLQLDALNEHRTLDGRTLLTIAPTSAGKTFIGEMAAVRAMMDGRKAVFLLPYRALVNEKYDQFDELYGSGLGMRVIRCTGDYTDHRTYFVMGRYDLALLTYEMFLYLGLGNTALLNQLGLVVVDEAQFITDPMRGIVVELLLTLLIAARKRGISPQLLALSAVIGDINHFDEWLGCDKLVTTDRPVRLIEGVIDRSGVYQYLDAEGVVRTMQLVPQHEIVIRREEASAQDVVVPLVRQLVAKGEKVIVFRNQRGKAQGCAAYLARDLGLPIAPDASKALPTTDATNTSRTLSECVVRGTAFHTSNLSRDERRIIERAFRDPDSNIRVLAATTTVAAGINTPASTVIIAEQEFLGEDGRPFTIAEYKNMAGRAGRLGFQEEGKSIVYAASGFGRDQLFQKYVLGKVEPIRSSLDFSDVETWVLRLMTQVRRIARDQVLDLVASTYGGYLGNRQNPGWSDSLRHRLSGVLDEMLKHGLVEQMDLQVQLTVLGMECGKSGFAFRSIIRLLAILNQVNPSDIKCEFLIALVQALPELDRVYTPLMKRGRLELQRPQQASSRYGASVVRLLQTGAIDNIEYLKRCKRACVIGEWIDGVALEAIEQKYTPSPYSGVIGRGDVIGFSDATRFHLSSAFQIASIVYISIGDSATELDGLLKRLETGLPQSAINLLELPMPLQRGEYLALANVGFSNIAAVAQSSTDTLAALIGESRANDLHAAILSAEKTKLIGA